NLDIKRVLGLFYLVIKYNIISELKKQGIKLLPWVRGGLGWGLN
ncbi:MAG: hypothetical protein RLZZ532_4074, partial [Cyanobacteriota bacterium]